MRSIVSGSPSAAAGRWVTSRARRLAVASTFSVFLARCQVSAEKPRKKRADRLLVVLSMGHPRQSMVRV
ncbi:hypothetical protein B0684_00135 [Thioalkalivibrio versutus]|nr:hypothetical protein B0684_00135 [Thioalkalivibrio versutus]